MNNDLELKKQLLTNLFNHFKVKHKFDCILTFNPETPTCFELNRKILNIDNLDLKNHSLEGLAWILAHEVRHVMQMDFKLCDDATGKSSKLFIKNRRKTFWIFFITFCLLSYFDLGFFREMSLLILAYVFFGGRIIYSDEYIRLRRIMEEDADNFANQEVGTGGLVFFNYLSPKNKRKNSKWKKILFGNSPLDMYPTPYERLQEAMKYPPKAEVLDICSSFHNNR